MVGFAQTSNPSEEVSSYKLTKPGVVWPGLVNAPIFKVSSFSLEMLDTLVSVFFF